LILFFNFAFHPLCAAESRRLVRGFRRGLMKQLAIRLSWQTTPAKSLVMFERVARIPQPPDQSSNAGHREAAANRGRLLFGYFILAKQKKVACCRATPGGFYFSLCIPQSARRFAATLRQADETTSHSTRLSKDDSQVAGYQGERP
jgi:hypothetical protein